MNGLERQILELHYKVDQLNQIVERLTQQIETVITEQNQSKLANSATIASHNSSKSAVNSALEHKDILDDYDNSNTYDHLKSQQPLSPEIQIRRLTAQLTAAYNRIASLEEQLLSVRVYP